MRLDPQSYTGASATMFAPPSAMYPQSSESRPSLPINASTQIIRRNRSHAACLIGARSGLSVSTCRTNSQSGRAFDLPLSPGMPIASCLKCTSLHDESSPSMKSRQATNGWPRYVPRRTCWVGMSAAAKTFEPMNSLTGQSAWPVLSGQYPNFTM